MESEGVESPPVPSCVSRDRKWKKGVKFGECTKGCEANCSGSWKQADYASVALREKRNDDENDEDGVDGEDE